MTERRQAAPTVKFVDEYSQGYQQLFPEVRSFEAFKYLHVGMISEIKRYIGKLGKVENGIVAVTA